MAFPDKPGPPQKLEAGDIEKKSVSLKWRAPKDDGGSPVLGYVVEYRMEGAFKWISTIDEKITDTKYKVTGLREKNNYEFQVAAINAAGAGTFCSCEMPICVMEPIVGDAPRVSSSVSDVTIIGPEVATLECGVKPGTEKFEISWYVKLHLLSVDLFPCISNTHIHIRYFKHVYF